MSRLRLPLPRRLEIRVDVAAGDLRATATRGGVTLWSIAVEQVDLEQLGSAFDALLAQLPRGARMQGRPRLLVRLGPELVCVKQVHDLPSTKSAALLSAVVREGVGRFFIGESGSLLTSDVVLDADGRVVAGAFRRIAVEQIARAVRDAGLPEPVIVAREDARLRCPTSSRGLRTVSRLRAALASAAAVVSLVSAALLPGLIAARSARTARADLAALQRRGVEALGELDELNDATSVVAAFEKEESSRLSSLSLLAALSSGLPEGSALVMLRIDSAGGTVVAVTPRAGEVVSRLGSISGVDSPEISGPVTREVIGGRQLERVTVRFSHGAAR